MRLVLAILLLGSAQALAGLTLHTLRVSWDTYPLGQYPGTSNAVITVYKSTSLGTVFTPYKPTAYCPANRTNINIQVLPGTYHFYCTANLQPIGESVPSNICTNYVSGP